LDLRDLRYFEAIADTGHVGRAAKSLCRTQPALTGAVRRLEQKLGTPLFERAGRGIRLTAAGEALHVRARAIRMAAQEAEREVADIGRGDAGLVRIGMAPTAAKLLMAPLFRGFLDESPALAFKSTVANNDVLRALLRAGELDLSVELVDDSDADLVSHPLFHDECVVVASRSHPLLRTRVTMREMLRYGWILGSPTVATREWLEHAFRSRGLPCPAVQLETNQILFLPELMEQNRLLSFVSRRHLAARTGLREVRLRETTMRRQFAARHRKDGYLSPAARRVLDALRAHARRLRERT